jgi:K+-sensing histidine kinase KdpD
VAFGEELGRRVGAALETVSLNQRIRERLRREESVARLGQRALEESDPAALFEVVERELAETLGADIVSIHEVLQDRPVLRIVAGLGWRDGIAGHAEIPASKQSQAGYAVVSDGSVVSADYERERRFQASPLVREHGARSGVTTPIRGSGRTWGSLGVYSRHVGRFDPDEVAYLESVANVLGSAISRREVEAQLERMVDAERRASELGQAFVGVVSHELRTPITSIYAGAKLLRRMARADDDARRRDLTEDIEAEADRLYRLTEDLLVLTRVERGGLVIGIEPLVLGIVLQRAVASERTRWAGTTIDVTPASALPIVLGDETYVEQLVRNLVGNAAKYSPPGSRIEVVAESAGDEVLVRVLDEGPGIADDDLGRLFQLFYRSPRTARKAPGAGIGLFVCEQLARAMGGRIWARNRPSGGSEFGFSLRALAADSAAGPAGPASGSADCSASEADRSEVLEGNP